MASVHRSPSVVESGRIPAPVDPARDPFRELLEELDRNYRPSTPCPHDGTPEWDAYWEVREQFAEDFGDDDDADFSCVASA